MQLRHCTHLCADRLSFKPASRCPVTRWELIVTMSVHSKGRRGVLFFPNPRPPFVLLVCHPWLHGGVKNTLQISLKKWDAGEGRTFMSDASEILQ